MIGTLCVLLRRGLSFLKRNLLLLLVMVVVATPASAFAEALSTAAVDQVLAAIAEVVKEQPRAAI